MLKALSNVEAEGTDHLNWFSIHDNIWFRAQSKGIILLRDSTELINHGSAARQQNAEVGLPRAHPQGPFAAVEHSRERIITGLRWTA